MYAHWRINIIINSAPPTIHDYGASNQFLPSHRAKKIYTARICTYTSVSVSFVILYYIYVYKEGEEDMRRDRLPPLSRQSTKRPHKISLSHIRSRIRLPYTLCIRSPGATNFSFLSEAVESYFERTVCAMKFHFPLPSQEAYTPTYRYVYPYTLRKEEEECPRFV